MIVTIFEPNGRKELHYWIQEYAWVEWVIYDVSQKSIDLIFNCETHEIQSVIDTIIATSRRVSSTLKKEHVT